MRIEPEVIWVFRQGCIQNALRACDGVEEVQRLVLSHFVREGQVLARSGHLKRSTRGVLSKGVNQNDVVFAVLVVKVLVQAEACVELAKVTFFCKEVGEVAVVEATGVVDLARGKRTTHKATVL